MTDTTDIAAQIKGALRRLVFATVIIYAVLAGLIAFVAVNEAARRDELSRVALSTNHALCVLRSDLEQRVADSAQFLLDHPNGFGGISAATIQQGIDNQQRTIDALSDLRC